MSRKIETIEMISGQLDVVEAKLNDLLKKFGYDDDDLWIIRRCAYNDARELAEKKAQHSLETFEQPDLFPNVAPCDFENQ
jgi:translation elongation factor EF-Tu-like GTPase